MFPAGEEKLHGIHAELPIALRRVVTLHALGFDDRLDRRRINRGILLGAFVDGKRFGFSAKGDRKVGGEVILAVSEGSTVVTSDGNKNQRCHQETRIKCPASATGEMMRVEHPHANCRGGDAKPAVIGKQLSAVITRPCQHGADSGGSQRRERAKPEQRACGRTEIGAKNPMQDLKCGERGEETNGQVDNERVETPNEKHPFLVDRWCRRDAYKHQCGGGQTR